MLPFTSPTTKCTFALTKPARRQGASSAACSAVPSSSPYSHATPPASSPSILDLGHVESDSEWQDEDVADEEEFVNDGVIGLEATLEAANTPLHQVVAWEGQQVHKETGHNAFVSRQAKDIMIVFQAMAAHV